MCSYVINVPVTDRNFFGSILFAPWCEFNTSSTLMCRSFLGLYKNYTLVKELQLQKQGTILINSLGFLEKCSLKYKRLVLQHLWTIKTKLRLLNIPTDPQY